MGLLDWLKSGNSGDPDETDQKLIEDAAKAAMAAAQAGAAKKALEKDPKKEEKKQHNWQHPYEMIKFVCMGGKTLCPYALGLGEIIVTSTQVKLQDKFWATAFDRNGAPMPNILFKSICMHPKWGITPPLCPAVIQLGNWENVSETMIDIYPALLRKSTIKCLHSGQDIYIIYSGQKAFIEEVEPQTTPPPPPPPGHYYTDQGVYLGKKLDGEEVYITDPATYESIKKNGPWSEASIIRFTEKYGFTNKQLLNRAHWVYGEGGGNHPDHYAHAIINLRQHGVWGPAKKPYLSDEAMYSKKMTHKETVMEDDKPVKKIVNLYPGYFNGSAGAAPAKNFAVKRVNPIELNDLKKANGAIKAVIESIMGITDDPTDGCYQWVGGKGSGGGIYRDPAINNATGVVNVTSDGYYHTFYKILKE